MRNIRNWTENWKQPLFDDGEKNLSLPIETPFADAPETLTLTREGEDAVTMIYQKVKEEESESAKEKP